MPWQLYGKLLDGVKRGKLQHYANTYDAKTATRKDSDVSRNLNMQQEERSANPR